VDKEGIGVVVVVRLKQVGIAEMLDIKAEALDIVLLNPGKDFVMVENYDIEECLDLFVTPVAF
jgi:hypothetical protein